MTTQNFDTLEFDFDCETPGLFEDDYCCVTLTAEVEYEDDECVQFKPFTWDKAEFTPEQNAYIAIAIEADIDSLDESFSELHFKGVAYFADDYHGDSDSYDEEGYADRMDKSIYHYCNPFNN